MLIVISGLILGHIYHVGGRLSVILSLHSAALSVVASWVAFLLMGLLFGGGKDLFSGIEMLAPMGIPYVVSVVLYDCYRKASGVN